MKTPYILLILFILVGPHLVFADSYTKNDVRHYIVSVENKLKEIKTAGAADYAQKEIQEIEDLVQKATSFLTDNKLDMAYYEINVANKYFDKITAIKRLAQEKNKYEELQKKITQEKNQKDTNN